MRSRNPNPFMWHDAVEMFERAEKLHRQFFTPAEPDASGPCWEPPIDVLETEDAILIIVALPGVEPDELKVLIDDGTLVVAGNRPMPGHPSRMMLRRLEIPHGHFERQLKLPAGRYEIGQRELRNGCLLLSLRKLP
ncbi:MAG: Hsp20/alpha crystallin family protein [Geminicoccaceae bacterium]